MAYTPTGDFSTPHKMRLLLSQCATVQSVLEVDGEADPAVAALDKINTYGDYWVKEGEDDPLLPYPRILINDNNEVQMETDTLGGLLNVINRSLDLWIAFYVPDLVAIEDINDEHAWVRDQFSAINREALALTGRGESIPGHTHLVIQNPNLIMVHREPEDERGDPDLDPHPELSRWFGLLMYEVH